MEDKKKINDDYKELKVDELEASGGLMIRAGKMKAHALNADLKEKVLPAIKRIVGLSGGLRLMSIAAEIAERFSGKHNNITNTAIRSACRIKPAELNKGG